MTFSAGSVMTAMRRFPRRRRNDDVGSALGGRPHGGVEVADVHVPADAVWLLMDPAVFTRLTGQRKWTAMRFRTWFTDTVTRLLLDPGHARL